MNNLSSYCGLTDSRMRASNTDLRVTSNIFYPLDFSRIYQAKSFIYKSIIYQGFFSRFTNYQLMLEILLLNEFQAPQLVQVGFRISLMI